MIDERTFDLSTATTKLALRASYSGGLSTAGLVDFAFEAHDVLFQLVHALRQRLGPVAHALGAAAAIRVHDVPVVLVRVIRWVRIGELLLGQVGWRRVRLRYCGVGGGRVDFYNIGVWLGLGGSLGGLTCAA